METNQPATSTSVCICGVTLNHLAPFSEKGEIHLDTVIAPDAMEYQIRDPSFEVWIKVVASFVTERLQEMSVEKLEAPDSLGYRHPVYAPSGSVIIMSYTEQMVHVFGLSVTGSLLAVAWIGTLQGKVLKQATGSLPSLEQDKTYEVGLFLLAFSHGYSLHYPARGRQAHRGPQGTRGRACDS